MVLDQEGVVLTEGFGLDVEIDVIVEALAYTRTEIAAVRLSASEQTKTHLFSSVRASQRAPNWPMSLLHGGDFGDLYPSGKDYLLPDLAQIPIL
jgi:hypothetical protein